MKEIKKITLRKKSSNKNQEKVTLYSTEGNSCSNAPYSANCSCDLTYLV
jgi:hypothetical protein